MTTIQSDLIKAQQMATAMGQAADDLEANNNANFNLANKTNIKANDSAKETSKEVKSLVNKFIKRFEEDIQNVKTAAKEFERLDESIKSSINRR